jgi:hypothetical protein
MGGDAEITVFDTDWALGEWRGTVLEGVEHQIIYRSMGRHRSISI